MTDPLSGVWVKIDRAKKHFNELRGEVAAFQNRNPYFIITYCDTHSRHEVYQLEIIEDIPTRWGGAVGDIVHNLRASLDLLANCLVRHGGGTPTKYTKFPISSAAQHCRNDIASGLVGASLKARRLVERLQPYNGGRGDAIFRLHELDIVDKHRLLVPVGGAHTNIKWELKMANRFDGGFLPAITVPLTPDQKHFPLKNGDVLFRFGPGPDHQNKFEFVFEVAFGEGQIFDGEALVPTLKQLIDFTERLIKVFARQVFGQPC